MTLERWMKKSICLLLSVLLIISFAACDSGESEDEEKTSYKRIKESPAEDFEYDLSNGEVIITEYVGKDREIRIPEEIEDRPVTTIGEAAFNGYDLTYIYMPDTITVVEGKAFASCVCLENVKFSDNLEEIWSEAFYHCDALETVDLPKSLRTIGNEAFSYSGVKKVLLPQDLEYIGRDAFGDCENLERLEIPDDTQLYLNTYSESGSHSGISVYIERLETFIGGSGRTAYSGSYMGYSPENTDFGKLPTVVVVKEGSYAHQQIQEYEHYGVIQYELK